MIETVELQKSETPSGHPLKQFFIRYQDGQEFFVNLLAEDVETNRHYQEVKEWYQNQEKKPFDFNFEG
jgi:hypothetical protein